MILTFRSRALARFWLRGVAKGLPVQNAARVRYLLGLLNTALRAGDMNLPGLHFHSLAPGQPGRFSIRVTANYRLTWAMDGQDVVDVDLEDYH